MPVITLVNVKILIDPLVPDLALDSRDIDAVRRSVQKEA